jgi:hypothetical protein
LVDLFEYLMMHGLTNPRFKNGTTFFRHVIAVKEYSMA